MILGSILRLKKDDINKEVMVLFYLSLFEIFLLLSFICLCTGLLYLMTDEFFIQMLALSCFIINIIILFFSYLNIIRGGIYLRNQKKFIKNSDNLHVVSKTVKCKRESHYLSKFAKDRYYRYYLKFEYEFNGKVYKGRTNYFFEWDDDLMKLDEVNVLVNANNFKEYFSEM